MLTVKFFIIVYNLAYARRSRSKSFSTDSIRSESRAVLLTFFFFQFKRQRAENPKKVRYTFPRSFSHLYLRTDFTGMRTRWPVRARLKEYFDNICRYM